MADILQAGDSYVLGQGPTAAPATLVPVLYPAPSPTPPGVLIGTDELAGGGGG